ncbi:MAG: hypothetical protein ACJAXW_004511 [Candidatus Azotimanducaceae bacterium]|jgi:hypothetical protein
MISGGGRPAGIGVVYKYSFADSTSYGFLTWQYHPTATTRIGTAPVKALRAMPGAPIKSPPKWACIRISVYAFLRLTTPSPSRAEPNSHAAAGRGTADTEAISRAPV